MAKLSVFEMIIIAVIVGFKFFVIIAAVLYARHSAQKKKRQFLRQEILRKESDREAGL